MSEHTSNTRHDDTPEQILEIDANLITGWRAQRQHYENQTDKERAVTAKSRQRLAESIAQDGINTEAIIVQRTGPDSYRGIEGFNRWMVIRELAAKEGRVPLIRAIVLSQNLTDGDIALRQRKANIRRSETTTELIQQITTWLDEDSSRTRSQAAVRFCVKPSQMSILMGIAGLPDDLFFRIDPFPRWLAAKLAALPYQTAEDQERKQRYVEEYVDPKATPDQRQKIEEMIVADWDKYCKGTRGRKRKTQPTNGQQNGTASTEPELTNGSRMWKTEIEGHPGCFLMVTFSPERYALGFRREVLKSAAAACRTEEMALGLGIAKNGKKKNGDDVH